MALWPVPEQRLDLRSTRGTRNTGTSLTVNVGDMKAHSQGQWSRAAHTAQYRTALRCYEKVSSSKRIARPQAWGTDEKGDQTSVRAGCGKRFVWISVNFGPREWNISEVTHFCKQFHDVMHFQFPKVRPQEKWLVSWNVVLTVWLRGELYTAQQ